MAQKVRIELVSDLSNEPIADGEGSTVRFSLDGRDYEIDLSTDEENTLREALSEYVEKGRKSSSGRGRSASSSNSTSAPRSNEASKMREWAKENGFENVSSRGRVNAEIVEAYKAANK